MTTSNAASPAATRRTKTLLLTVLGDAVIPLGGSVWQETLVRALTTLGASVPAARQAVARAVGDGWLTSVRTGRRARMTMTDETIRGIREGRERTLAFGQSREWHGDWLFVALTVPEESRALRYHFRTELAWLGFGSLGNGLWISPHPENEAATQRLLRSSDSPGDAYVFTGARPASHTPEQIASAAWDMESLRERYTDFLSRFESAVPRDPAQYFTSWVELVTSWRHFPLFDPELPERLLPADWPRVEAYRLYHQLTSEWTAPALEFFRALEVEVTTN
ncbi:MAG: PaaX family transcriptional regulator [Rhodoglobus sp.]|nr:PaaX family transcriptional regulator [Rhodoglobus sp.]